MDLPRRKPTRLKGYDYSQGGAYFITICMEDKEKLLCRLTAAPAGLRPAPPDPPEPVLRLLPLGEICKREIESLPARYQGVTIDSYAIMPDHIHMIIFLEPIKNAPAPTIHQLVGTFKSITTKAANKADNISGRKIWQRSFHDRIIRTGKEYDSVCRYIDENPLWWRVPR